MVYDPKKAREISIKGKQITNAFEAGKSERIKIAERTNTGGVREREFKTPADGPGGYNTQPYDDFGNYRGPRVPGHPGWAKLQINPNIAGSPSFNVNDPYLPGGQNLDGIKNLTNPKLKDTLKKRKGVKGPTGATLPPINLAMMNPDAQKALMIQGLKTFQEQGGDALGDFLKKYQQRDPKRQYQPSGSLRIPTA